MAKHAEKIGWIGMGRMGFPWPSASSRPATMSRSGTARARRPSRSPPRAARWWTSFRSRGRRRGVFDRLDRQGFGGGLFRQRRARRRPQRTAPEIFVDCSTIAVEESADIRKRLSARGVDYVAAPVSGNAKVIKAGKLSAVVSGPEAACKAVTPMIEVFAPQGVSYVGDGELARVCKIAHNVMLGVVIENLIEITLLANKMGVPRHAFLAFINNSVMARRSRATNRRRWSISTGPRRLRPSCCARTSISASPSRATGTCRCR